uniref:Uncharacterized protein n=1 Tax=Panagrolaimus sp. JU765 TaxID=591449 RepID=A0AC34RJ27_9BILA
MRHHIGRNNPNFGPPEKLIPSRKTYTESLKQHHSSAAELLKKKLANPDITGYAVILDKTPVVKKIFGVKIQLVDNGKLYNVGLAVNPIQSATSQGIKAFTDQILADYGLNAKKAYFVFDEGTNMVIAFRGKKSVTEHTWARVQTGSDCLE